MCLVFTVKSRFNYRVFYRKVSRVFEPVVCIILVFVQTSHGAAGVRDCSKSPPVSDLIQHQHAVADHLE